MYEVDKESDEIRTPAGDGEEIAVPEGLTTDDGRPTTDSSPEPVAAIAAALDALDSAPVVEAGPVVEASVGPEQVETTPTEPTAEARAAGMLADEYRKWSGVVPELISGSTVEEVAQSLEASRKAFEAAKAAVLREQGAAVPGARSGGGPAPVPATPGGMIEAGLAVYDVKSRR